MISSRRSSTAGTSSSPRDGLRRARDPPRLGQRLVRPQQRLRGHARPERALAADQPVLDDRDAQPGSASRPAATSPAGPAPITTTSKLASALRRLAGLPTSTMENVHSPWGRHGFDVAGSQGRLRAEVPEAS